MRLTQSFCAFKCKQHNYLKKFFVFQFFAVEINSGLLLNFCYCLQISSKIFFFVEFIFILMSVGTTTNESTSDKRKEYLRFYYLKNKERVNEGSREYYLKNKEKAKDYYREYNIKNKEKVQEITREYRLKNKEKLKQYYIKNKEKQREKNIRYFLLHKGKAKEYYQKKVEKLIQKRKEMNENYVFRKKKYSWKDPNSVKSFFEKLGTLLGITDLSGWYRVSSAQIGKAGGYFSSLLYSQFLFIFSFYFLVFIFSLL